MKMIMAPMEGVGGYVYRNAFEEYFGPVDTYVAPFIGKGLLTPREKRDVDPKNNRVAKLIPQIMGGDSESFHKASLALLDMGYTEVNVNMGCPSGTVTARKRGAGLLSDLEKLRAYCDAIFSGPLLKVSLKTRIGMESAEEWPAILDILKDYPWAHVTIHPRARSEFYDGPIHPDAFELAYKTLSCPLIYNGEINSRAQAEAIQIAYPDLAGIMIGRGFLRRPWLAADLRGEARPERSVLVEWHRHLLKEYATYVSGDRNLIFKMKDLWNHLPEGFVGMEKEKKALKKSLQLPEFVALAEKILREGDLSEEA